MLNELLLLRDYRWVVPAVVLSLPTVPYFLVAVSWGVVSSILPKKLFAKVDDFMYSSYQRACLFFLENYSGCRLALYGDVKECFEKQENVLYISNHQCTVDWAVADMMAVRQGSLGSLRYMLKDALQYLPLYGWYFYQHGSVYVRRGKFRQDITCKGLEYLSQLEANVWIVLFPEGTRYAPGKKSILDRSNQFMQKLGEKPLNHVLSPRSKGLKLILESLRHRLDAVYDVTVAYESSLTENGTRVEAPTLGEFMVSPSGSSLHVHIKRIPIENVPKSEDDIHEWLIHIFKEKDRLLNPFFTGENDPNGGVFPNMVTPNSCLPLYATLTPLAVLWSATLPFFVLKGGPKIFFFTWTTGILGAVAWMRLRKAA